MVCLFENDVETLGGGNANTSLLLGFFGAAFGAAVSFGITLLTAAPTAPLLFAGFVAAFVLSAVLTVFFGIKAMLEWCKCSQQVKRILNESRERERDVILG